jgi:hypothetical protein
MLSPLPIKKGGVHRLNISLNRDIFQLNVPFISLRRHIKKRLALVVKWISQRPSKPLLGVRILSRAPVLNEIKGLWHNREMKKFLFLGVLAVLALSVAPLFADAQQGLVPCGVGDPGDPGYVACTLCHLFQLLNNIINIVLFVFIPIVAPIFIVIGGIYLLIARDNPQTLGTGKNILTATVVGLIIVYTAWLLLNTTLTFLGVASWTRLGSWWQIECPL